MAGACEEDFVGGGEVEEEVRELESEGTEGLIWDAGAVEYMQLEIGREAKLVAKITAR